MATCKDCVGYNFCSRKRDGETDYYGKEIGCGNVEDLCGDFKNKADYVPVVSGKWLIEEIEKVEISNGRMYKQYTPVYKCSLCNTRIVGLIHMKYCPDCGARMDGDAE